MTMRRRNNESNQRRYNEENEIMKMIMIMKKWKMK